MDRVTRYPIFSIPHSAHITGLALDGDTSYPIELVGVGPEERSRNREEPQAWPADRRAPPDTVKTGAAYGRWAFASPRPSARPHPGDDEVEVKVYHLDASDVQPRRPQGLEQARWEVYRGPVVRSIGSAGTVVSLGGASDRANPGPPDPPQSTHPGESMVDREQIDFVAARQQFMILEQANKSEGPQKPPAREVPTSAPPGANQLPKASNRPHLANGYVVAHEPQVKEVVRGEKWTRGLPPGPSIPAMDNPGSWSRAESPGPPKETPIEREIRLAQEREADLREQRGLRQGAGQHELVRIPSRPLLTTVSLAEPPRRDRGRPSLYVQRDMVQETQREEDHRREGLQVGRASTSSWVPEDPQPALRKSLSSDSILSPSPDARAADPVPEARKVNRIPPDAYWPYLGPSTPQPEPPASRASGKPSSLSTEEAKAAASPKATGSPGHLSESSGKRLHTKQEGPQAPGGPLRTNGGVVRWEYFRLRPLRFGVPDAPQQAETAPGWSWEVAEAPALRLQKSLSSELLEREVESVLRREREVAEERRNAFFPEVFSPSPDDWEQDSRSSSRASGITGSYSVSESPSFSPVRLHSSLVWTAEAPEDGTAGHRRKELWYAGINPSDSVNSEVLGATRVTRHKNIMAERWEAGIYAREDKD